MSATAAVIAVECLRNKMPFSQLHFSRPLLRRLQFSYQPLTFLSLPPTQAPPKHPFFIQVNEVKVQHGFKKIYAGWCATWSSCGRESLLKENRVFKARGLDPWFKTDRHHWYIMASFISTWKNQAESFTWNVKPTFQQKLKWEHDLSDNYNTNGHEIN